MRVPFFFGVRKLQEAKHVYRITNIASTQGSGQTAA